jgi:undecaprenyl-diphosphatase
MKKTIVKTKKYAFNPTVQLMAALGLLGFSVAVSRGSQMAPWEIELFTRVYNWPDYLHPFFYIISQLGSIYMLGLLLLIYMIKRHYHIVLRLLLTGTLAYMAAGVAKDLWGRMRPHEFLLDVVSLEYLVRGPGFPSGHMALATALAFTVGHYLPKKYRLLLVLGVIGVGLSRIYLGVHAPLDIVGGFAIGWAAYALFRHVRLQDIGFGRKTKSQPVKKLRARKARAV